MSNVSTAAVLRIASSLGFAVLLGAAGPDGMQVQIGDVGPLAQPSPAPAPGKVLTFQKTLTFQNTLYQAAPVPDEDAAPPPGAVRTEAELAPKVLSPTTLFQGDGYSNGSSQQASLDGRKAGAAGLGLNIPVK